MHFALVLQRFGNPQYEDSTRLKREVEKRDTVRHFLPFTHSTV